MLKNRRVGLTEVITGCTLWGASGTVAQALLDQDQVPSGWLTGVRLFWAGLLLLVWYALGKGHTVWAIWRQPKLVGQLFLFSFFRDGPIPADLLSSHLLRERADRHGLTISQSVADYPLLGSGTPAVAPTHRRVVDWYRVIRHLPVSDQRTADQVSVSPTSAILGTDRGGEFGRLHLVASAPPRAI